MLINYWPRRKFAKVMFSQVSVCPQGGVCGVGTCIARGRAWWGAMCGRGGVCGRGACVVGDVHGREACVTAETATAAGGTRPTGMHSC